MPLARKWSARNERDDMNIDLGGASIPVRDYASQGNKEAK